MTEDGDDNEDSEAEGEAGFDEDADEAGDDEEGGPGVKEVKWSVPEGFRVADEPRQCWMRVSLVSRSICDGPSTAGSWERLLG